MALSLEAQRQMLAELQRLSLEREAAERKTRGEFETANARAQTQRSDARQAAIMHFQLDRDSTQREYDVVVAGAKAAYETRHEIAKSELEQALTKAQADHASDNRRAKKKLAEENWEANTVYEATQNAPKLQMAQEHKEIAATQDVLRQAIEAANHHLMTCRLGKQTVSPGQMAIEPAEVAEDFTAVEAPSSNGQTLSDAPSDTIVEGASDDAAANTVVPPPSPVIENPAAKLTDLARDAVAKLESLRKKRWPLMLVGGRPSGFAFLIVAAFTGVTYPLLGTNLKVWLPTAGVLSLAAIVAGVFWIYRQATADVIGPYRWLHIAHARAQKLAKAARELSQQKADAESLQLLERREKELQGAKENFEKRTAHAATKREAAVAGAKEKYRIAEEEFVQTRDTILADAHRDFPKKLDDIQKRYQQDLQGSQRQFEATTAAIGQRRDEAWNSLAEKWREGAGKLRAFIEENVRETKKLYPSWDSPQWNTWQPPTALPPFMPFGRMHVDLKAIPAAISHDQELNGLLPPQFDLPALFPFPQNASLLLKATGEGRRRAIDAVQALMLRMLTAVPPSKLRFTIIDPVGLGENFAGFMHLADHDELLVTNRIWTEPGQIEARLADLTETMENVIQKYLRNEFKSIDEYNAFAGEVAEPFRILVVANFPVNFTETAARRLVSITTTGARCGVYTLLINDAKLPFPPQFEMKEIERSALTLSWNGERFEWEDPDFKKLPLTLECPPPEEQFTPLVQTVGRGAKLAKRVEVPFEYVAPSDENRWTGDSAKGIRVALGRAGATKLQYLHLGEGTSQHSLIAGKTGSGKSTLLHAIVTNLALTYSPDQIELYLIDFKKGVEFKTYATHQLPHARVIAIESEREFGLSVIEKLDAELKRRGDLFRKLGVQDVAAYRAVAGADSMPRILLMVDEFQELFTDDDKLAQDAALLLDRLVRQGRAFGMHVMLGSQTLGGAYSLARSTIGQMAVRIALQCSEADAHLILSEENSAARLLSRPGEAIYNDANGLVQGNHPFQIVWLGDEKREKYLKGLLELTQQRLATKSIHPSPPPIVFEGNLPAVIGRNRALTDLLRAPDWPVQSLPIHAWLGDAIAIKDPTSAVFRPQSGDNLLLVGQRAESAMGMLASTLVSLALQHRPAQSQLSQDAAAVANFAAGSPAQFYIVESDPPADLPLDRPLADFRGGLSPFSTILPHPIQTAGRREVPALTSELAREIERRQTEDDRAGAALYLFISDLGRFRDLRRDESDLGYGFGGDKPATPSQLLGLILRDGPAVGVYTVAWADSLTSVQRCFDRQTLREFTLRILLQMSANDSSHLIDSPAASRLGPNVALFHNEEEGRLEKFRPYAWPTLEWLETVQQRLNLRLPAGNV